MSAVDADFMKNLDKKVSDMFSQGAVTCPNCGEPIYTDANNPEEKQTCPNCGHVWRGSVVKN